MIQPLIVFVTWISLASVFFAMIDGNSIKNGIRISKEWKRNRGLFFLLANIGLAFLVEVSRYLDKAVGWSNEIWYSFQSDLSSNLLYLAITAALGQTVYWTVFDLTLNLYRGKSWHYISDNGVDHNDAFTDTAFHSLDNNYSGKVQFAVKVILLIAGGLAIGLR